jgi:hypothetical protein
MTLQPTRKLLLAVALVATVLGTMATISTLAAMSNGRSIQSYGTVKSANVGVYWDSGCTNATTIVNWGMLSSGASANVMLYVRNEGNVALKLSLTTENWNPSNALNYMTLGWNRQGQTLNAGSSTQATLTLFVFQNATGITNFSFDIIITGAEQ